MIEVKLRSERSVQPVRRPRKATVGQAVWRFTQERMAVARYSANPVSMAS